MDTKDIENIMKSFKDAHSITKLEWSKGDEKFCLEKSGVVHSAQNLNIYETSQQTLSNNNQAYKTEDNESSKDAAPYEDSSLHYITAPLVGTFYQASSPNDDPFVSVGTKISKGQTLCIIEAMKLMNEIVSEVSGTVEAVLVNNAQSVEYGSKLFAIKTNN